LRLLITLGLAFSTVAVNRAFCQQVNVTTILDDIGQTADRICNVVSDKGDANHTKIEGEINAQLTGLASKIAKAGVKVGGDVDSEKYEGALRKDLPVVMNNNALCKLKVFEDLQAKLLPALYSATQGTQTSIPDLGSFDVPGKPQFCSSLKSVVDASKTQFKTVIGRQVGGVPFEQYQVRVHIPHSQWCYINTTPSINFVNGRAVQMNRKYYNCEIFLNEKNFHNADLMVSAYVGAATACLGPDWSSDSPDHAYGKSYTISVDGGGGGPKIEFRTQVNDSGADLNLYLEQAD